MNRAGAGRAASVALAWCLLVLGTAGAAHAHGLTPALLSLRELEGGRYEVTWRTSALRLPGANVRPVLPAQCRTVSDVATDDETERLGWRWTVDCGPRGLAGATIAVEDLAPAKIAALLRIERTDGGTVQSVLSARVPAFTVPETPTRWDVVRGYVRLGAEHIASGPDHLLFVFGLLLLVPARRQLVQTITAFTLGHSITLSAAALHVATVPSRPVEVLIALSVLTLAVELAREHTAGTLLRRFPWAMALTFGMLHGFGFAGALAEAGLPAGEVPMALLSFNVGIELGQLAFVGLVLAAGAVAARVMPSAARSLRPAVYAMGILSAFWCFERVAAWLG